MGSEESRTDLASLGRIFFALKNTGSQKSVPCPPPMSSYIIAHWTHKTKHHHCFSFSEQRTLWYSQISQNSHKMFIIAAFRCLLSSNINGLYFLVSVLKYPSLLPPTVSLIGLHGLYCQGICFRVSRFCLPGP